VEGGVARVAAGACPTRGKIEQKGPGFWPEDLLSKHRRRKDCRGILKKRVLLGREVAAVLVKGGGNGIGLKILFSPA